MEDARDLELFAQLLQQLLIENIALDEFQVIPGQSRIQRVEIKSQHPIRIENPQQGLTDFTVRAGDESDPLLPQVPSISQHLRIA